MEWRRSGSAQFPRQKIYLTSLSQLMERKLTVQPEVQIQNKLFPNRNFAKRLSISHPQRTKSSAHLKRQRFDLHLNTKQAKNMIVQSQRVPTAVRRQPLARHRSQDLPNTRLTTSTHLFHQSQPNQLKEMYSSALPGVVENISSQVNEGVPHRNFLRKGSNIQKQIVVNLLRTKLLKERELNQKKQYSNGEIIKMIQVFRGVTSDNKEKEKRKNQEIAQKTKVRVRKGTEVIRDIKGWQNQNGRDYEQPEQQAQGQV